VKSPLSTPESVTAYLKLVLNPMLRAFGERGFRHVVIVGNVDVHSLPIQDDIASGVTISGGRLSRDDFLQKLSTAEVIATAPGRTTLLEIGAMGQRALVLPPQNLSQAMCALEVVKVAGPEIVVNWPADAVDVATIVRERGRGEDFAVQTMYEQMINANREFPEGSPQLATGCAAALEHALSHESDIGGLAVAGFDGAEDVANNLGEVLAETDRCSEREPTS
jgi:hydroxymethylcytosylglucuronate/cytosylglucuronate synthase